MKVSLQYSNLLYQQFIQWQCVKCNSLFAVKNPVTLCSIKEHPASQSSLFYFFNLSEALLSFFQKEKTVKAKHSNKKWQEDTLIVQLVNNMKHKAAKVQDISNRLGSDQNKTDNKYWSECLTFNRWSKRTQNEKLTVACLIRM